jgi:predicted exporter
MWRGSAVDTSILSLLPASEGDPLLTESNALLSQRASHLMAFVIGHRDAMQTVSLGQVLNDQLRRSPFVKEIVTELSPEKQKAFYDLYFPFRYQMLSPEDRQHLTEPHPLNYFVSRLVGSLYSPTSSFFTRIIPQDPLLFFPALVRSWMEIVDPRHSAVSGNGISFVDTDGTSYAFSAVELVLDPFESKNQDRMLTWLRDLRRDILTKSPESHFYVSGVLPFAAAERLRTEREMTIVSLGSLFGVLLLTLVVFESIRAVILAALPLLVGFIAAVAATLLCFGHIHIITFAFGSSLIGVAIDYPVLYLAFHRTAGQVWDAEFALRQALPGLLLGATTTLLGYAALSLAPFPGLRQMALFSSVGLCAALITVILVFPILVARPSTCQAEPRILTFGKSILIRTSAWWQSRKKSAALGLITLSIFIIWGLSKIRFDDDIRLLQSPSESIVQEDSFVRKVMKGFGGNQFILIRASTLEELLERQELLQEKVNPLIQGGVISSIQSLAPFLPSVKRQVENRQLLDSVILSQPASIREQLSGVGLSADISNHLLKDLSHPFKPFTVDQWLASPASHLLRSLWIGSSQHEFASAVLISGLSDPGRLRASLKDMKGIKYFDQIEEYSNLFRRYRHLSLRLILAAYCGVWVLTILRYGFKRGTWVTFPAVAAVLFTFALYGWCGVRVQLIHCLAALLVLSMGIDYTIYFAECARARRPVDSTLLAVEMCAVSSLLSFGLLALCKTPVLSSIGMTVFCGMLIAFLLSPMPYWESVL